MQRGCPKSPEGVGGRDGAIPPSPAGWLGLWMSVLLQNKKITFSGLGTDHSVG